MNFDCQIMMDDRVSSLHDSLEKAKSDVVQFTMLCYRILELPISILNHSESELTCNKKILMITTMKDELKYDDIKSQW